MTRTFNTCGVVTLVLITLAGCKTPTSKQTHNAAKERWASTRSNVLYSLAKQQFDNGELDKAEKTIAQALEISPTRADHYELAARVEIERGRLERAYHLLELAVKFDDKRSDSHYLMGTVLHRWQRFEQALAQYERAYELRADDPTALIAAAEMLVKLDRADEAVARLEEKLTYFENNAPIRVELGTVHVLRHDFPQAVRCFREASLLNPEDLGIGEFLALAQSAAGEYGDAAERLKDLLGNPKFSGRDDLRLALGDCYAALQRPMEARAQFLKVTERNPNDADAWIKLGQMALLVDDPQRLDQAVRRILVLTPNRPEGHLLRGMAQQKAGQHGQAIAEFDAAAQLSPNSATPLLLKGVSLERSGDRGAAAAAYRRALDLSPDDDRAQRLLAAIGQRH